ncbi:MFS transporter [Sulfurimonas sp. HSL-3221]|uniref:MFS transporter n=1 Tax=Sulfurimonadaceae TaxID=2771471 RepID=UPI001E4CE209|nr:MFS transporter [Sulfurimonas sp. HSL-3221]UFS61750.1 MFS transporter [Sulfurimonas sp. HSL-3221]
MKHYIALLKNEPLLRRISSIQLIAYFGAWFSNVAIFTLLLQLGASPLIIATVAALHFLPGVLQAPFSGALIDKIAPKRLMLALLLVEIVTTLPLVLVDDAAQLWLLFVLVFVRMGASSFYFTLEMALLPRFLKASALKHANEIHSIIWSVSYTVGMALSGIAVYYLGVRTAFVTDAALFAVAFALLLPAVFPPHKAHETARYLTLLSQSVGYLKRNPLTLHLIFLHAFVGFTAFDGLVPLAAEAYYLPAVAAPLAIGLTHAFRALGLVGGPLLLGRWITVRRLPLLLLLQAAAIFLWAALLPHFYLSLAVSVFVGLSTTVIWSFTYTLLQHHTEEAYYGRVIAYNDMIFLLTVSAVSFLIGVLVEWGMGLQSVMALLGVAFIVSALYFGWIARRFVLEEPGV